MKILEWSKINTGEKYMNEVSGKIVAIKTEVCEQNWETMMFECQQSRLPVKEWCRQNGINPSTYYSRLRKLREKVCNEIIPIEAVAKAPKSLEIKITLGDIVVALPSDSSTETIKTVLTALRSC